MLRADTCRNLLLRLTVYFRWLPLPEAMVIDDAYRCHWSMSMLVTIFNASGRQPCCGYSGHCCQSLSPVPITVACHCCFRLLSPVAVADRCHWLM